MHIKPNQQTKQPYAQMYHSGISNYRITDIKSLTPIPSL